MQPTFVFFFNLHLDSRSIANIATTLAKVQLMWRLLGERFNELKLMFVKKAAKMRSSYFRYYAATPTIIDEEKSTRRHTNKNAHSQRETRRLKTSAAANTKPKNINCGDREQIGARLVLLAAESDAKIVGEHKQKIDCQHFNRLQTSKQLYLQFESQNGTFKHLV